MQPHFLPSCLPPHTSDIVSCFTITPAPEEGGSLTTRQRKYAERVTQNKLKELFQETSKARIWKLQTTSIYNCCRVFRRSPGITERARPTSLSLPGQAARAPHAVRRGPPQTECPVRVTADELPEKEGRTTSLHPLSPDPLAEHRSPPDLAPGSAHSRGPAAAHPLSRTGEHSGASSDGPRLLTQDMIFWATSAREA